MPALPSSSSTPPAISVRSLQKSYVENQLVLAGVDLDVTHGQVHSLVGANGSGKSTLVKVLSGFHAADTGSEIRIGGQLLPGQVNPDHVRALGVRFVHQDSVLLPGVSVLDNMAMGDFGTGPGWRIHWREEANRLREQLSRWGLDIDPRADLASLSLPTIARLAVLKALRRREGDMLNAVVLDEPTAALGREDAAGVLDWLRELAVHEHVGVLFVSHRLGEVLGVSDKVSVLRAGRIVDSRPATDFTEDSLVEQIVGTRLESYYPPQLQPDANQPTALAVSGLQGGRVTEASFKVARGEVLGVTGIPGSGFEDIPYLLGDPHRGGRGTVSLYGAPVDLVRTSIRERTRRGLVLIPADRKRLALATDLTVRENLTLPAVTRFFRGGRRRGKAEVAAATELATEYGVNPPRPEMTAGRLSGGNQQKVVLAKWLSTKPSVLLMHEPTQAVDVGARADIFRLIAACAQNRTAIVLASVEYEDLARLCDRVLVFGSGRITADLSGAALTPDAITATAYLAHTASSAEPFERMG